MSNIELNLPTNEIALLHDGQEYDWLPRFVKSDMATVRIISCGSSLFKKLEVEESFSSESRKNDVGLSAKIIL